MARQSDPSSDRSLFPPQCVLFEGTSSHVRELKPALSAEGVAFQPADVILRDSAVREGPTVLVVDDSLVDRITSIERLPNHVVVVADDATAEAALGATADLSLVPHSDAMGRLRVLRAAFQLSAGRRNDSSAQLAQTRSELTELNRIGMALMTERDRDVLLHQILEQVMRLTGSDAGVLYLLEKGDKHSDYLRFKLVLCDSVIELPVLEELSFPVDSTSVAGHAAKTRQPLVIDDVYNLPKDAAFALNLHVEMQFDYWRRSMLTIPMVNQRDETVGVLQLINRKSESSARIRNKEDLDRYVNPYSDRDVHLAFSLAGQAAVSIENAQLYGQIEHLFDCFVKASVTAIDQRDPATAGHSIRVATLVTGLAAALERSAAGSRRGIRFTRAQMRELRYAALLHDFGKVAVREDVLIKARKLPPFLWERVHARFELIRSSLELDHERKRARLPLQSDDAVKLIGALDAEFKQQLAELDRFQFAVAAANEPTPLADEADALLVDVANHWFADADGEIEPYLTEDELHYLRIPHGSLDHLERLEIEAHAEQTSFFLSQIPWTDDLKEVTRFASGHHEKLNGTGYPRHLAGKDIPVQTRIVTIADIFDALTAADRPYRHAVSTEKALDILQSEANAGLLDTDLVQVMIESQVYRRVGVGTVTT